MATNSEDGLSDLQLLSDNSLEDESFFDNFSTGTVRVRPRSKGRAVADLFNILEEGSGDRRVYGVGGASGASGAGAGGSNGPRSAAQPQATSTPLSAQKSAGHFGEELRSYGRNETGHGVDGSADDDDYLGFDPKRPKSGKRAHVLDDLIDAAETSMAGLSQRASGRPLPASLSRQSTNNTNNTDTTNTTNTEPSTSQAARGRTKSFAKSPPKSTALTMDRLSFLDSPTRESDRSAPRPSGSRMSAVGSTANWLGLSMEPASATTSSTTTSDPTATAAAATNTVTFTTTTTTTTTSTSTATTTAGEYAATFPSSRIEQRAADVLRIQSVGAFVDSMVGMPASASASASAMASASMANNEPPLGTSTGTVSDELSGRKRTLLENMSLESGSAIMALHQQESQLSLAARWKAQEQTMAEMQNRQKELIQQQEQQFETLMARHMKRQAQVAEYIRLQHDRINANISILVSPPSILTPDGDVPVLSDPEGHHGRREQSIEAKAFALKRIDMEAKLKKFELEKLRLEELVETISSSRNQEMHLLETTYKKQLEFMEEHHRVMEGRFRTQMDEMSAHYSAKLDLLALENCKLKADCEETVEKLKTAHASEIRRVRQYQDEDIEVMKTEHRRMLETIRQAKVLEISAIQDHQSYLTTLRTTSDNLAGLSEGLLGIRQEMQERMETLTQEREKHLEMGERKLEDAQKRVRACEEAAQLEKRRLVELVASLEQKLLSFTKETSQENWSLRQQLNALENDRECFAREKEFFREQLQRDEKRIGELKQLRLEEMERIARQLREEQGRLITERNRFEMIKKLQPVTDVEDERLRLEESIRMAQEAKDHADSQQKRYLMLQKELESDKLHLLETEHVLHAKQKEIDRNRLRVRQEESKCEQQRLKIKSMERTYKRQLDAVRERMHSMIVKEEDLSEERMLLTQERLGLHDIKSSMKQCALCTLVGEPTATTAATANADDDKRSRSDDADGQSQNGDERVRHSYNHIFVDKQTDQLRSLLASAKANVVDNMLDEKIYESLHKMRVATGFGQP